MDTTTQAPLATSATPTTIDSSLAASAQSNANSNINPTTFTSPIVVPPATTPTNLSNILAVGNPQMGIQPTSDLVNKVNDTQATLDPIMQQIRDLNTQLGFAPQDASNMRDTLGVNANTQKIQDLNLSIAQEMADFKEQQAKIASQGIASVFSSGQLAENQALHNARLGGMVALQQAISGNLNTAFNTIDKTISEKYQPLKDNLDKLQTFYNTNKANFTEAQTRLATRQSQQITAQQNVVNYNQKLVGDAVSTIKDAVGKGLLDTTKGFQTVSDILSGKITPSDALKQIGATTTQPQVIINNLAQAISSVESGGNYNSIGTKLTTGQNAGYSALGKYQIMPNLWFKTIGLDANNPADVQKFLNTPALQDQLFQSIIGSLQNQYGGDTQRAVAAYFGGDKAAQVVGTPAADKITDGNMSVNQYVNKVMGNLQLAGLPTAPGTTGKPQIDATAPGYTTAIVPGTGNLTQAAIDQRALSIAMGSETAPKAGSGLAGLNNRAINARVGELNASGNIAANKVQLKSLSSTLTEQSKYNANITRSLAAAEGGFSQINTAFQNSGINTSESAFLNSKVNAVNTFFGNNTDALRSFQSGLYEVQNEYAQVFSRGGQRSIAGNEEAQKLLSGDISIKDLMAIQNELQTQGGIVKTESDKIVQQTQDKINGIVSGKQVESKPADSTLRVLQPTEIPSGMYQASDGLLYKK